MAKREKNPYGFTLYGDEAKDAPRRGWYGGIEHSVEGDDIDRDEGLPPGMPDDAASASAWEDSLTARGLIDDKGKLFSGTSYERKPAPVWDAATRQAVHTKSATGPLYTPRGCDHDGSKAVLVIDGVTLHGARKSQLLNRVLYNSKAMILNCTGNRIASIKRNVVTGPWDFSEHVDVESANEVLIDWPDMQPPPLKPSFWPAVWERVKREHLTDITAICAGSHGRTGTTLACLLVAKGWSADDAIRTIREKHCKEAVETDGQRRYIERVAEALNGEKPKMRPKAKAPARKDPRGGVTRKSTSKRPKSVSKREWKRQQKRAAKRLAAAKRR